MYDKITELNLLYDFYGEVLTERQQSVFQMYHLEDLSLGEIAEQLGVSRQAVYDLIHRSERTMRELDSKLKLIGRHLREQEILEQIEDELLDVRKAIGDHPAGDRLMGAIDKIRTLT